jgi:hypothetical protein
MPNYNLPPENQFLFPATPRTPWRTCWREHQNFLKRLDWLGWYFGLPIAGYIGTWFWDGSVMWAIPVLFFSWILTICGIIRADELGPKSKAFWSVIFSIIPVAIFYLISHRHPEVSHASETINSTTQSGGQTGGSNSGPTYNGPVYNFVPTHPMLPQQQLPSEPHASVDTVCPPGTAICFEGGAGKVRINNNGFYGVSRAVGAYKKIQNFEFNCNEVNGSADPKCAQ